jgi:hypothetical protein
MAIGRINERNGKGVWEKGENVKLRKGKKRKRQDEEGLCGRNHSQRFLGVLYALP